jgi:exodeoxyribonuclease VII large subunit
MRYEDLAELRRRLERIHPEWRLQQEQQRLHQYREKLDHTLQQRLQTEQQRCALLRQTLKSLDPEAVLKRGYALVKTERDRLLDRASQVAVGDLIQIQLAQGTLTAQVVDTDPG